MVNIQTKQRLSATMKQLRLIGTSIHEINQNSIQEFESEYWNDFKKQFCRQKLQIAITQENQIVYSENSIIQRIEQLQDNFKNYELLYNLDQIKHLHWVGQYGSEQKKIGNWTVFWKGEELKNVGGYYSLDGIKQGLWTELINNYWSNAQFYELGEYLNGLKRGMWRYIYDFKVIDGGFYNNEGQKNGNQLKLSEQIWKKSQLIYVGQYKNGQKIGQWDILFKQYRENNNFELIGGGVYVADKLGNSVKNGKWVQLSVGFWDQSQVIYLGEYKNGIKIGRWNILFIQHLNKIFELMQQTNITFLQVEEDHMIKMDLISRLSKENGQKMPRAIGIKAKLLIMENIKTAQKLVNGIYFGISKDRIIKLVEVYINWMNLVIQIRLEYGLCMIRFVNIVQYCIKENIKMVKKVGRWDILYKLDNDIEKYEIIQEGGGQYVDDRKKDSYKDGRWIEISNRFWEQSQITYRGQYKQGRKIGRWDIYFKDILNQQNELIGGGVYDYEQEEDSVKIGNWIEISNGFRWGDQLIFDGRYKNGKKIGIWRTLHKKGVQNIKEFQLISGGGEYNIKQITNGFQASFKIGKWIELSDIFWESSEIFHEGIYNNGQKIGRWKIYQKDIIQKSSQIIGGGSYLVKQNDDNTYISIKDGKWIELSDEFMQSHQITFNGEYKNGQKFGIWKKMDLIKKGNRKIEEIIYEKLPKYSKCQGQLKML